VWICTLELKGTYIAIDLSAQKFDVHKDVEKGSPPSIFNTTIYDMLVVIPRFSWLVV
jgi:hypothetical protein